MLFYYKWHSVARPPISCISHNHSMIVHAVHHFITLIEQLRIEFVCDPQPRPVTKPDDGGVSYPRCPGGPL